MKITAENSSLSPQLSYDMTFGFTVTTQDLLETVSDERGWSLVGLLWYSNDYSDVIDFRRQSQPYNGAPATVYCHSVTFIFACIIIKNNNNYISKVTIRPRFFRKVLYFRDMSWINSLLDLIYSDLLLKNTHNLFVVEISLVKWSCKSTLLLVQ